MEASIDHLYAAGNALAHRVSAVESRASWGPSTAYRASAAPAEPAFQAAPAAMAAVAAPAAFPLPAPAPAPARAPSPVPAPRAVAPSPTPAPPTPPPPPPRAAEVTDTPDAPVATTIDWERWIGVRGAAALGAGILVIALIYFLRYSIAVGWLTLELRVALGALVSAGCVGVSQAILRNKHRVLASWLTGAGIAGLFASVWAAQHVAGLLGAIPAFALVVLITGGCVALALRDGSLPIAWLGTAGGFAAPLSLAIDGEKPYGVIAYVLVLDVAMVAVAARKRWWSLSALAMLFTVAYEAVWITTQARAGILPLQVGVLTIFAGVFGAVPAIALGDTARADEPPAPLARLTRFGAVLVPFGAAAWLTLDPVVVANPAPIGALLVLLTMLSVAIAWRQREAALPFLAALGAPGVLLAWSLRADVPEHASSFGALLVILAVPHLVLLHLEGKRTAESPARSEVFESASVGAVIFLVLGGCLTLGAALSQPGPWTVYLVTLAAIAGALLVLSRVGRMPALASAASLGLTVGAFAIAAVHVEDADAAPPFVALLLCVGVSATMQAVAGRFPGDADRELHHAARRGSLAALLGLSLFSTTLGLAIYACFGLAFATSALAARGRATTYPVTGGLLALSMATFAWLSPDGGTNAAAVVSVALGAALLAAPLVRRLGLLGTVWAPRGAVVVMAAFAMVLGPRWLVERPEHLGAGTAVLAAVSLALSVAMRRLAEVDAVRHEAGWWLGATSIALTTASVGLSLDHEHMTWGLAAFGSALTFLAAKKKHDALAIVGVVHVVIAAVRLLANPAVLAYHPRAELAVLNWVLPTFLIPAACAGLAWWWLGSMRETTGEKYVLRTIPATLGLAIVFAWLNVTVLDVFSTGVHISFETDAAQARDLSVSLVWAVFGIGLLLLGMRRETTSLRWASLVLILVTAGKVFLYDLAQLEDLYRVASLAGLAVSLLGISLLYQRFVFRAARKDAAPSN